MAKLEDRWREPALLEAVFDQLSDALLLYDRNKVITGANRAAELLFGRPAAEMVGRSCQELFHCTACDSSCGMLVSIGDVPQMPQATVKLHLDNGREKTVFIRSSQLFADDGQLEGAAVTIRDISDEHEPQRQTVIAEAPAMRELMRFVRRVANSEATTVLLEGENGVGKDLIANTLHSLSPRQAEPFIAINCAAIPETLLESELFGYEKGAFTDAKQQKRGLFELADHGTLFLDEIGEIPLLVQAKLLRVLEDQQFRRLGGTKDIRVNLRVVAATNKNLREAVREGAFRQDLYFRLNVIQITIPPLRERREDVAPLTSFFVEHYNRKFKRQIEGVTARSAELLQQYPWPGNVRELRNAIERAMILEEGERITPESLPHSVAGQDVRQSVFVDGSTEKQNLTMPGVESTVVASVSAGNGNGGLRSLEEQEIHLLRQALTQTKGNQTQAAKLLGITRDTLRYKVKKYAL